MANMAKLPQIKQVMGVLKTKAPMEVPSRLSAVLKKFLPPLPGMPFSPHVPRNAGRNADYPELLLLYGWLGFAGLIGAYSVKKVMLSNKDGAYLDVALRGDYDRQAAKGWDDHQKGKHSMWWRVAQVKVDKDGANIGVLWDNRTRPHQYSKPGEAGMGAGLSSMVAH